MTVDVDYLLKVIGEQMITIRMLEARLAEAAQADAALPGEED